MIAVALLFIGLALWVPGVLALYAAGIRSVHVFAASPLVTAGIAWLVLGLSSYGVLELRPATWLAVLAVLVGVALGRLVAVEGIIALRPGRIPRDAWVFSLTIVATATLMVLFWTGSVGYSKAVAPLGSDGTNHAVMVDRLDKAGSLDFIHVLAFSDAPGGEDDSFYPLALHGIAQAVGSVSPLSPFEVVGLMPIVLLGTALPVIAGAVAWRVTAGRVEVAASAAVVAVVIPLAWEGIRFGTIPTLAGAMLWPAASLAMSSRGSVAAVATSSALALFGLGGLHLIEVLPAVALGLLWMRSSGWTARRAAKVTSIAAVIALALSSLLLRPLLSAAQGRTDVALTPYEDFSFRELTHRILRILDTGSIEQTAWPLALLAIAGALVGWRRWPSARPVVLTACGLLGAYLVTTFSVVDGSDLIRGLFYGEPFRVRVLLLPLAPVLISLPLGGAIRSLASWPRSRSAMVALTVLCISGVAWLHLAAGYPHFLTTAHDGMNTLTAPREDAYVAVAEAVDLRGGAVLNEPGNFDGSPWLAVVEDVSPLNLSEPLRQTDLARTLRRVAAGLTFRDEDPAIASDIDELDIRYVLYNATGFEDRLPSIAGVAAEPLYEYPRFDGRVLDLAGLCADPGLSVVFANESSILFEISGEAGPSSNLLDPDPCGLRGYGRWVGDQESPWYVPSGDTGVDVALRRGDATDINVGGAGRETRNDWNDPDSGGLQHLRVRPGDRLEFSSEISQMGPGDGDAWFMIDYLDREAGFLQRRNIELIAPNGGTHTVEALIDVPARASVARIQLLAAGDHPSLELRRMSLRRLPATELQNPRAAAPDLLPQSGR